MGVDLRHHERDIRLHPEGGAIIDDHRASFNSRRGELPAASSASREESDLRAVKRARREPLDLDLLTFE